MSKAKGAGRGKPVNLYLRKPDIDRIRALTAFIASAGERTSDSLIVRAALLAASSDRKFLDAYRQVAEADLRFRRT